MIQLKSVFHYKFSILTSSPCSRTEPHSLVDHSSSLFGNCGSICSLSPKLCGPTLYEPGFNQTWNATRTWNVLFVLGSNNLKDKHFTGSLDTNTSNNASNLINCFTWLQLSVISQHVLQTHRKPYKVWGSFCTHIPLTWIWVRTRYTLYNVWWETW